MNMRARNATFHIFIVLVLLLMAVDIASAQTGPRPQNGTGEPVQLTPGFTKLVRFDRTISTVVIGNPEVVDARAQTDRAIVLVGKTVGITNLIVLDDTGTEVFNSLVIVGARDAGKVIVHARKQLHEYWAYRCTEDNCVRVADRLEYAQPTGPIVVSPIGAPPAAEVAPADVSQ